MVVSLRSRATYFTDNGFHWPEGLGMSKMIAFKADDDEEAEIVAYMKARHIKSTSSFARMAIFAYMRQNKPGNRRAPVDTRLET
jgi:hypothetical protein